MRHLLIVLIFDANNLDLSSQCALGNFPLQLTKDVLWANRTEEATVRPRFYGKGYLLPLDMLLHLKGGIESFGSGNVGLLFLSCHLLVTNELSRTAGLQFVVIKGRGHKDDVSDLK